MFENRKIHVIVLRTAAVLLVFVMLSTSLVAGRYARYSTTVTASDSARVAGYQISVSSSSGNDITLSTESPASYTFSVASASEVAVEYDLIITLPKALPGGVSLSLTQGETGIALTPENNTYTATKAGTFSAQGGAHEYTLTFTATQPVGADTLESISVRVDARQVD